MRTFIVDDKKDILGFIKTLLESEGHKVKTFTDPFELIKEIDSSVDMVLSDVNMPACSGFRLAEKVAAKAGDAPPKTLLMSAEKFENEVNAASIKAF